MRVLADTHSLVWALSDPGSLSVEARRVLTEAEVTVSVASLWELVLKREKKNALLNDPVSWWRKYVTGPGIRTLAIHIGHVITLGGLPPIHRDPFDRILVAQSLTERVPLISKDAHLGSYGIQVIW